MGLGTEVLTTMVCSLVSFIQPVGHLFVLGLDGSGQLVRSRRSCSPSVRGYSAWAAYLTHLWTGSAGPNRLDPVYFIRLSGDAPRRLDPARQLGDGVGS